MAQMTEKQLILSIAFGGFLLTGGSFGGVYWAKGKIEEEKVTIEDLEKKIASAEAKKRRIPQDEKAVIILRENVGEYVKILPNGSELTDFARTVNSFVNRSGVTLKDYTNQNSADNGKGAFSKFVYRMSFEGTVWQFMKLTNLFESYKRFVSITSFQLTAGKPDSDNPYDDVRHIVTMTVETYTYNQAAGGKKPVEIVNYNSKRDLLKEEIYLARKQIRIDKFTFKGDQHRRDIFVDPRIDDSDTVIGAGMNPREVQKRIEDLGTQIAALVERYDRAAKSPIILHRYKELREIRKEYVSLKARSDELRELEALKGHRLIFENKIINPLETLAKELENSSDKEEGWSLAQLEGHLEQMADDLVNGNIDEVKNRYDMLRDSSLDYDDERAKVVQTMTVFYKKALAAIEFRSLPLDVTGVILLEGGNSTAIINGKTYQEGDPISTDLFLKEVKKEYLEFLFKGVVIAKRR